MAPQPCAYGTFSNTDYYIYYSTGTNKIIRNTSENEDKTKKLSIHSISAPVILSAKIAKGESRGKKGKRCFTCIVFAEPRTILCKDSDKIFNTKTPMQKVSKKSVHIIRLPTKRIYITAVNLLSDNRGTMVQWRCCGNMSFD